MAEDTYKCFVGEHLKNSCIKDDKGRNIELELSTMKNLDSDIKEYLKSLYPEEEQTVESCEKVTEKWLILNRIGQMDVPDDATICKKHRMAYGVNYKPNRSCEFPAHIKKFGKRKSSGRATRLDPIPLSVIAKCKVIPEYSANTLMIGSVWCNNCRLTDGPKRLDNIPYGTSQRCVLCQQNHNTGFHTPKKQCLRSPPQSQITLHMSPPSQEEQSEEEYTPSPTASPLNRSMASIRKDWTPVKILTTSFDSLGRTRKWEVLKKARDTINEVLEQYETKNIKQVSKIHHIKYIEENGEKMFHTWQYYGIGEGNKCKVNIEPPVPKHSVEKSFGTDLQSSKCGKVSVQGKDEKSIIYCTDPMCIKSFSTPEKLMRHLDFEKHQYNTDNVSQMSKVTDKWVSRYQVEAYTSTETEKNPDAASAVESTSQTPILEMGWAIPKVTKRRFTDVQKDFLVKVFDDGEKSGDKLTPLATHNLMKKKLDASEILPVSSIKSFFSRRAKLI